MTEPAPRPTPGERPRIAVFAGPTATVLNSAPLVTANAARRRRGLPLRTDESGRALRDVLRPQRLARPATVYVEAFSGHPLESEAAHTYAPADGFIGADGTFSPTRRDDDDVPVYEVVLDPADGLLPLPYMALRRDGTAWEGDEVDQPSDTRQTFHADAQRIFEEIDRLGVGDDGVGDLLAAQADYEFFRVLPSGGHPAGASGPRERIWDDYFPYRPVAHRREPSRPMLADLTNAVQSAMGAGSFVGGLWLEGSPSIEETLYWLHLVIDTDRPIVGCASPDRPHGVLGASGDRHLVDGARYVVSRLWAGDDGRDRVGAVLVSGGRVLAARNVQKLDARPGGYGATGDEAGVVASLVEEAVLTAVPLRRHTHRSEVRLSALPQEVNGVVRASDGSRLELVAVPVRDADGLLPSAIPHVSIVKHARFLPADVSARAEDHVEVLGRIEHNLANQPLAGFVVEGYAPYGAASASLDAAVGRATFSGMPVVRTSRGDAAGFVARGRMRHAIAGSDLTSTKARVLLMACLLRFGALPPARDPDNPTADERRAVDRALEPYQAVFDTH